MITQRQTQLSKDADAKAAEGNYAEAINLYEAALDGSASSADVHYKLALIYDDKMNDPLNALHHFKRFLTLEPSGKRAQEVKGFMKRDELTLLTNLTGDSMVPRSEVVRLNNENLNLRQQNRGTLGGRRPPARPEKASRRGRKARLTTRQRKAEKYAAIHRATGRHPRLHLAQVLQEFGALAADSRCQLRHHLQARRFEARADAGYSLIL